MQKVPRAGSLAFAAALAVSLLVQLPATARAGDSLYGTVTAIRQGNVITFDHGAGSFDIRLAGIDLPEDAALSRAADVFVTELILGKPARLRFDGRTAEGEMVGRMYTDDPKLGIKDVALELVRAGLAKPSGTYAGYKYAELTRAAAEARANKAGIWKNQ
jgi:endonuclease YncB( thermonuclease family)